MSRICGCKKNCRCVKSCEICNSIGMHFTVEHKCSKCGKHGHGHYECSSQIYKCCNSTECKYISKTLEPIFEFHTYYMYIPDYHTVLQYYTDGKHIFVFENNVVRNISNKEFLQLYSRHNLNVNCTGEHSEDVISYLKNRLRLLHRNKWNDPELKVFKLFYCHGAPIS